MRSRGEKSNESFGEETAAYRGAALLGADGEAEGDDVDDEDGDQHRGGAGHVGPVGGSVQREGGEALALSWLVPGIPDAGCANASALLASWLGLGRNRQMEEGRVRDVRLIWSSRRRQCRVRVD